MKMILQTDCVQITKGGEINGVIIDDGEKLKQVSKAAFSKEIDHVKTEGNMFIGVFK